MKITFKDNRNQVAVQKIKIYLKDKRNNDIPVELKQGDFVYSESEEISKSLKIYTKKRFVEVTKEEKPACFDYYTIYNRYQDTEPTLICRQPDSDTTTVLDKKSRNKIIKTVVDKAISDVKKYSKKSKKGPGRPKKRGPKKGSKRKAITSIQDTTII